MPTHIPTRTKQLGVRKLAANPEIDYTQYSVKSTLTRVPEAKIVLVPWRVFSADPESVCDSFRELSGQDDITYAEDINVMMNVEGLKTPEFGKLDDFSQTWIINTDEINLDSVIDHIKSNNILLGVTLTNRKFLGDDEEIPMVAFVDHKTPTVREAVMKLETCRDILKNNPGSKFSVEVDIGESVSRWSKEVLGNRMTCVGGRFCITNGDSYNHAFEWSNICAFLPCFLCCLVAIPVYKIKRKAAYQESLFEVSSDSCILGSGTFKVPDQRFALLTLMRRAQVDPKFARESPDSGVHMTHTDSYARLAPVTVAPAPETFTKKNDKTAVLNTNQKSKIKPKPKPGVIQMDYKNKKAEKPPPIALPPEDVQPPPELVRQDSYMQADDLDTIARAFKMSKSSEPRQSVASPLTLSNFRADLLFGDVDDTSDDEGDRRRKSLQGDNFLDPNYEAQSEQIFKKTPNPLTNIELMHFLTTKNKPAHIRNEEEQRRLELAKKKKNKVGKNWTKVQQVVNKGYDDDVDAI